MGKREETQCHAAIAVGIGGDPDYERNRAAIVRDIGMT